MILCMQAVWQVNPLGFAHDALRQNPSAPPSLMAFTPQALGAEVQRLRPVSISHPDHFVNVARRRAAEQPNAVFADQFENVANFRAHLKTGGCRWVGWLGVPPLCNMPNQSELLAALPICHKHTFGQWRLASLVLFRPGDLGADGRPRGCVCQRRGHRRHNCRRGLLPEAAAASSAGVSDRPTRQRPV